MPDSSTPNLLTMLPLKPTMFEVLLVLTGGDRHGYSIVKEIEQRTAGELQIQPGNLYRTLRTMMQRGLIEESDRRPDPELDDERRRYFRITPFGVELAKAEASRMEKLVATARAHDLLPGS